MVAEPALSLEEKHDGNRSIEKEKKPSELRRMTNLTLFFFVSLYLCLSPPVVAMFFEFVPIKCSASSYEKLSGCEEVWLTASNGARLHSFYFPAKEPRFGAIIHHGQGENIGFHGYIDTARVLNRSGASVLLYDYEGFGASEGSPSNAALIRDGEAAYDFLIGERGFSADQIIHCGLSLGAGPASALASSKPCGGVILMSSYLSLREVSQRFLPYLRLYPDWCFPQPALGSACLADSKVPLLLIHGEIDPLIDVSNARRLKKMRKGPTTLIVVPNAMHVAGLAGDADSLCKDFFRGVSKSLL